MAPLKNLCCLSVDPRIYYALLHILAIILPIHAGNEELPGRSLLDLKLKKDPNDWRTTGFSQNKSFHAADNHELLDESSIFWTGFPEQEGNRALAARFLIT